MKLDIEELEQIIKDASVKYYSGQHVEITDDQFDLLVKELVSRKPNSDVLRRVGFGYVPSDRKVYHVGSEVGSLDKVKIFNDLPNEYKTQRTILTPKLDGISVVVYYVNGKLSKAVTRGNGVIGIDCTNKVIHLVPNEIESGRTVTVRGEVVCPNIWKAQLLSENIPSQRNFAAGIINRLEYSSEVHMLRFVPYFIRISTDPMPDYWTMLGYIHELFIIHGYVGVPYFDCHANLSENLLKTKFNDWSELYPIDGVVIALNDSIDWNGTNYTINSLAYKFEGDTAKAIVGRVLWNTTYTGRVTPVVELKTPVFLSGANISMISGYNKRFIIDSGIGSGAEVEIVRSGEVIPVIKNVLATASIQLPRNCPACGEALVEAEVDLVCENPDCFAKSTNKLIRFTDIIAPVDGLGVATKLMFFSTLNITNVPSLLNMVKMYSTDALLDKISGVLNYGMHARMLLSVMLSDMKKRLFGDDVFLSTNEFLLAIGIPGISEANAIKLSELDLNEPDPRIILDNAARFGAPSNVLDSLEINMNYIEDCMKYIVVLPQVISKPTYTMTVAITGKLSMSRDDFEDELEKRNIGVDKVRKGISYLITDNPNSGSSKNQLAAKLGIPTINEEEFRKKYL